MHGELCAFSTGVCDNVFCLEDMNIVLTVSLGTDEAGGGAVKEGEKASHS